MFLSGLTICHVVFWHVGFLPDLHFARLALGVVGFGPGLGCLRTGLASGLVDLDWIDILVGLLLPNHSEYSILVYIILCTICLFGFYVVIACI